MTVRFFVICYGEAHADLLERVAIRSLTQPQNKAAVPPEAIVALYSDEATMERAKAACERLAPVEAHLIKRKDTADADVNVFAPGALYDVQNGVFIEELGRCVKADAAIVIVNPDCFWGDGSLANLLAIAGEQNVAVAAAHPRVDRDRFIDFLAFEKPPVSKPGFNVIDNRELVSWARIYFHQSWRDADAKKPTSSSYLTGISIRNGGDTAYVTHLQPTVWYARPTARDYAFFEARPNARGLWDHFWPEILAQDGRLRIVGSSDAVFIAELTDAATHNTELRPVDPKQPDAFYRDTANIRLARTVVSVWRED